jgi:hypothetical protein
MDKGYHNGRKLPNAQATNTTIVAHPTPGTSRKRHATGLFVAKFKYNAENDSYTCPKEKL